MLINWKIIAENIYKDLKNEISKLPKKPKMAVILVWENSPSMRYVEQKRKKAEELWIIFELINFKSNISENELISKIRSLNDDNSVHGFMVQLPLPKHISEKRVINNIHPKKDIDGFTPKNLWKVMIWDETGLCPCTPAWIMEIFKAEEIDLEWKIVCVVWRSNIVWKPTSALLTNAWATVINCNSKTKHLRKYTSIADIIIMATGQPELLKVDMVKSGSVVIDVGFSVIDWKIFGDADTKLLDLVWAKITPVPGWVWVLTVCMLMKNILKAFKNQNK